MEIIDGHVHIGHWPKWDLTLTIAGLDKVMREYGFTGAVVIPPLVDGNKVVASNLALQKQVEGRPDLFFFPWVHVAEDGSAGTALLQYLETNLRAIDGLKFHASISQTRITDHRLAGALSLADHHSLPLLYHCGRHPLSSAAPIRDIAPSYPRVKFIIAHLGGNAFDIVVDTMNMFKQSLPDNVYVDTSTARHPSLLRRALDVYGEDRILFGTDLPFTEMSMNWACLEFAHLTDNEKILGGNLRRVLNTRS